MRGLRIVLLGITSCSLFAGAVAQAEDFGRSGGYVGANAAYAFDLFKTEIYTAAGAGTVPLDYSDSWGFNVRAGYRLLSFLAIEAQYEWLDGIDISAPAFGPIGTYEPDVLTGNLKLILPTWRLQPYALAGIGIASWDIDFAPNTFLADTSGTGFAFRGGGGLDIYLTEHLVLNTEGTAVLNTQDFTIPSTVGVNTLQTNLYYFSLSAGFTYRF
jgi:hypothetical protein